MPTGMHTQLEVLLEIQDLKAQCEELAAQGSNTRRVQEEEFRLDVDEAVAQLREKIRDLEDHLNPAVRQRYDRISKSLHRVVVPAINGLCYGCFVSIPTSVASESGGPGQEQMRTCENCGRFLYVIS